MPLQKISPPLNGSSAITAISFLLALILSWLGHPLPRVPPAEPPIITVLCYHTFDSPKVTPYTVTHQRLNEEMRFLAIQHIPVIPLPDLVAYLNGTKITLPPRSVVITIDDGYKSAYTVAWPVIRRYGFPFTLFIYSGAINRHPSALTWDQVETMAHAGVDIESHTLTHPLLTNPGKVTTRAQYTAWIDNQLVVSKKEIEDHVKHPITALAYPYGGYSEFVVERVQRAGYKGAFTCDDADATEGTAPLMIYRRLVFRQTTLRDFAHDFSQHPLGIDDRSPRDGEHLKEIPAEISGRILNIEKLIPQSARILVDKAGSHWTSFNVDPASGRFKFRLPKTVKRGYYFVTIVAKERVPQSLVHRTTWLFIVGGNTSKK